MEPGVQWREARRQMLADLEAFLQGAVWNIVEPLEAEEQSWAAQNDNRQAFSTVEMRNRVERYLLKAAENYNLQQMEWDQCCKSFVRSAMNAFAAACWSRPWFYMIKLEVVWEEACKILLRANQKAQCIDSLPVNRVVQEEYISCKLESAKNLEFWKAAEECFKGDPLLNKVYSCLSAGYYAAWKSCGGSLEKFIKAWIENTVPKLWGVFSGRTANPITCTTTKRLFHALIAPWGFEHRVSGIPTDLLPCGPTPCVGLVDSVICNIFKSWDDLSKRKKRRR